MEEAEIVASKSQHSVGKKLLTIFALTVLVGALPALPALATHVAAVDFTQCSNGATGEDTCVNGWINGILNATHNLYHEDEVVPQRLVVDLGADGALTGRTVTMRYQTKKAGIHAYDSLATWNHTITGAVRCQNLLAALCVGGSPSTFPIPDDPFEGTTSHMLTGSAREFTIYGGTITNITAPSHAGGADEFATVIITYDVPALPAKAMFLWGGHLAASGGPRGWGEGQGASSISGGPFHFKCDFLDAEACGSQDNQIMSATILPPPPIPTVTTDCDPFGAALGAINISLANLASQTIVVTIDGSPGIVGSNPIGSGVHHVVITSDGETIFDDANVNVADCSTPTGVVATSCDPFGAAQGSITVTVSGEALADIIAITINGSPAADGVATLLNAGAYTVDAQVNGTSLAGFPQQVAVAACSNPTGAVATSCDPFGAAQGSITVTVSGEALADIVAITINGSPAADGVATLLNAGAYTVDAQVNGTSLAGFPQQVAVAACSNPTGAVATSCDPFGAAQGSITVTVSGEALADIVAITINGSPAADGVATLLNAGAYTVDAQVNGTSLAGFPQQVNVAACSNPSASVETQCDPFGAALGSIDVSISGLAISDTPVVTIDGSPAVFGSNPASSGLHDVLVTVNGALLLSQQVLVTDCSSPEGSVSTQCDPFGAALGSIDISVAGTILGDVVLATIDGNSASLGNNPAAEGLHLVVVTVNGTPIINQLFLVEACSRPAGSVLAGCDPFGAALGSIDISVLGLDPAFDTAVATIDGSPALIGSNALGEGTYDVDVQVNGTSLAGFPQQVVVDACSRPSAEVLTQCDPFGEALGSIDVSIAGLDPEFDTALVTIDGLPAIFGSNPVSEGSHDVLVTVNGSQLVAETTIVEPCSTPEAAVLTSCDPFGAESGAIDVTVSGLALEDVAAVFIDGLPASFGSNAAATGIHDVLVTVNSAELLSQSVTVADCSTPVTVISTSCDPFGNGPGSILVGVAGTVEQDVVAVSIDGESAQEGANPAVAGLHTVLVTVNGATLEERAVEVVPCSTPVAAVTTVCDPPNDPALGAISVSVTGTVVEDIVLVTIDGVTGTVGSNPAAQGTHSVIVTVNGDQLLNTTAAVPACAVVLGEVFEKPAAVLGETLPATGPALPLVPAAGFGIAFILSGSALTLTSSRRFGYQARRSSPGEWSWDFVPGARTIR